MSQVHILPWAPPEFFAAGTLGLECPKLGTLALSFLWLVVNRVLPLAASLQLLSLWSSFGLISQTMQTAQGCEDEGGGGKGGCLVLFSNSVLRRHPTVEISGAWMKLTLCKHQIWVLKERRAYYQLSIFTEQKNAFTAPNVPKSGWMGVVEWEMFLTGFAPNLKFSLFSHTCPCPITLVLTHYKQTGPVRLIRFNSWQCSLNSYLWWPWPHLWYSK